MFHKESYNRHQAWYNQHFPTDRDKVNYYQQTKGSPDDSVAAWLQDIFFACLDPLLTKQFEWLTVGDAYGFDAHYILSKGSKVVATDLNSDFLKIARQENIINEFAAENAEHLSYRDNTFDFVLCKESYHHFPRPYAALYEMIRVARRGIVIIEPQDPVSKMPLLLLFNNLFSKRPRLLSKVWKNKFSYEPVGNFVYKVSEREFEKFAAGLNLPVAAFKKINPNFYFKGVENIKASCNNKKFFYIQTKKRILDGLTKLSIFPGQVLATIIFKEIPDIQLLHQLKMSGYHLSYIPKNPYND